MNRRGEQIGAICLVVLLSVGAALLLGFACIGGGEWILTAWQARSEGDEPQFYENIEVSANGEPFIRHGQWTPVSDMTYYDLDRNPIPQPNYASLGTLTWLPAQPTNERDVGLAGRPRVAERVTSVAARVRGREQWFLIADKTGTRVHFEGYDMLTNRRIGSIGASGFDAGELPAYARFDCSGSPVTRYTRGQAITGQDRAYVLGDGVVRMIDFAERDASTLAEGATTIANVDRPQGTTSVSGAYLAVRLNDALRVYDETGTLTATFPIPSALRKMDIQFYNFGEEALLIGRASTRELAGDPQRWRDFDWPHSVARVSSDGRVLSNKSVTLHRNQRIANVTSNVLAAGVPALAWLLGVGAPSMAAQLLARGQADSFWPACFEAIADVWPALLIVLLVTGLCVWLVLRFCNRHDVADRWIALGAVILFGLPGYIGYRLHRNWPKRRRPIDVPRTGAEILA